MSHFNSKGPFANPTLTVLDLLQVSIFKPIEQRCLAGKLWVHGCPKIAQQGIGSNGARQL